MNILIISHYFLPHVGGIENVIYAQAMELRKKYGSEITIITSQIPPSSPAYENINGIKIIRVRTLNLFEDYFGIPFPVFSPNLIWIMIKEMQKHDLVHIHGHVYISSMIACLCAKIFHKKIFLTQHNTFVEHQSKLVQAIEHIFDLVVGRLALQSADIIGVDSFKTKKYVESIIRISKKIVVLYNGIDTVKFSPPKHKNVVKNKLGLTNNFICLSIRRITFKNGIDTLIKVCQNFSADSKISFVLGGVGPDLDLIKKYIVDHKLKNIKIVGYITNQNLPLYYQAADVFILPSKKGEGFPLVVLEAFGSGIPVIATKSGGHEEIIQNRINGFLVDVDDVQDISQKINYLYQNPKLLSKMSDNARTLAVNEFSWQQNVTKLYQMFQKIIA